MLTEQVLVCQALCKRYSYLILFYCLIIFNVKMLPDLYNPKKQNKDQQKRQKETEGKYGWKEVGMEVEERGNQRWNQ